MVHTLEHRRPMCNARQEALFVNAFDLFIQEWEKGADHNGWTGSGKLSSNFKLCLKEFGIVILDAIKAEEIANSK